MLGQNEYAQYYCAVHKKTIYYHKNSIFHMGFHCWDCWLDDNNKKYKRDLSIKNARMEFTKEFTHLWVPNSLGGITGAANVDGDIVVSIQSSVEVFNEVPNEYRGFTILKQIVGEAA